MKFGLFAAKKIDLNIHTMYDVNISNTGTGHRQMSAQTRS